MKTLGKIFVAHAACLIVAMLLIVLIVKFTLGDWGVLVAVALPLVAIAAWMIIVKPAIREASLSLIALAVAGLLAYYFVWMGEGAQATLAALIMSLLAVPAALSNRNVLIGMGAMIASIIGSDLGFIVTGDIIPDEELWVETVCPMSYIIIMAILAVKMMKDVPDWTNDLE